VVAPPRRGVSAGFELVVVDEPAEVDAPDEVFMLDVESDPQADTENAATRSSGMSSRGERTTARVPAGAYAPVVPYDGAR
jgi:hypothetical protein